MGNNNLKRKVSILLYVAFLLVSCVSHRKISTSGVVVYSHKFYDPAIKDYVRQPTFIPGIKIWYKDSMVIEEIPRIYINTDTNGHVMRYVNPYFYTFIDLPTRSFYDFSTFSDTSKIIKKYTQPDSLGVAGGWNFYSPFELPKAAPPVELPDTLMEGINYKRLRLFYYYQRSGELEKFMVEWIGFFRCDKKGTMFRLDSTYSKMIGCPLVRSEWQPSKQEKFPVSVQIEYIRDSLTPEELRVFKAWGKKAKMDPVQKE
ncbi:MAG TPA: hypothetical protein VK483_03540 [Chitinophagaceae bacterium]|nr:hypothetical protein [Chitinophagaceae bacterium]